MGSDYKLHWKAREKSKLLCSGTGNALTTGNQVITTIECVSGKTFKVNGQTQNKLFKDLKCKNKITGDVQETATSCGNGGTLMKIGFDGGTNGFFTFIEVCYKKSTGSALYTSHVLHGNSVFTGCVTEDRSAFKFDGTIPAVQTVTKGQAALVAAYTEVDQRARFGMAISSRVMLAKGHLTPYCDAIYPTWKHATQFYINTAPEWRRINGANWLRVETLARRKAQAMRKSLQIYTGTHNILKYNNANMMLMASGTTNLVEVPEYFWKVIKDPSTDQGIALVTLNDVFTTHKETICPDICTETKWNMDFLEKKQLSDYARGHTYCCDVNEFRKAVPNSPEAAAAKNILYYDARAPSPPPAQVPPKRQRGSG